MKQKKISLPEAILIIMITGFADLFELVAAIVLLVPVVGQILWFVRGFVSIFSWLSIQFWLKMKKIKGLWFLSGSLLDVLANFLGVDIPFGKTASIILTINLANHPKISKVAEVATGKIGSIGKPEAAEA